MLSQHSLEDDLAQRETQTKTNRNPDKDRKTDRKTGAHFYLLNSLASWLLAQTAFVSSAVREV